MTPLTESAHELAKARNGPTPAEWLPVWLFWILLGIVGGVWLIG